MSHSYIKRALSVVVALVMTVSCLSFNVYAQQNVAVVSEEQPIVVISGSDFQDYTGFATASSSTRNLLNTIKKDHSTIDGFLFAGDYSVTSPSDTATSQAGLEKLQEIVTDVYGADNYRVFISGNHDQNIIPGITESGANDPDSGDYGVFVINEDDFMWQSNTGYAESYAGSGLSAEQIVKQTAANLDAYLKAKLNEGFDKPIFIVSHLALHYSMRTRNDGDEMYANYVFDVINDACYKGLDVIYLFGHNHSQGWDEYIGGSAIYLPVGSDIKIAQASKYDYKVETLGFTYMNAGYVGYYSDCQGADNTLTMCAFEIYNDKVVVTRYDANGVHILKHAGATNNNKGEGAYYTPNPAVYNSPQTIYLGQEKPVPTRYVDNATGVAVTTLSKNVAVKEITVNDFSNSNYEVFKAYSVTVDDNVSSFCTIELPLDGITSRGKRIYVYDGKKYVRCTYTVNSDNHAVIQTNYLDKIVVASSIDSGEDTIVYTAVSGPVDNLEPGRYVLVCTKNGTDVMLPNSVTKGSTGSQRIGFDLETIAISGNVIEEDMTGKTWELVKTEGGWLLSAPDGYAKLNAVSGFGIAATLEETGDVFTIRASSSNVGTYYFSTSSGVLNYNNRGVINGYANDEAPFRLYKETVSGSYELDKIGSVSDIKDGETYVFAINGLSPTGYKTGSYAMLSTAKTDNALAFREFDEEDMDLSSAMWTLVKSGSGFYMQAADGANAGKYLVINGNKSISLSETPMALFFNLTGSGEGYTIKTESGANRVRFSNSVDNTSGFTGAGNDSSAWSNCYFQIYHVVSAGGSDDTPDPYETPAYIGIYSGGWSDAGRVTVDGPGEYTLDASRIDSSSWVIVKNVAGEREPTAIPGGTTIRVTEVIINGESKTFDGGKPYYDYKVGANGEVEILLHIIIDGVYNEDHIDDYPSTITSLKVTFVVDPDNVPEKDPEEPVVKDENYVHVTSFTDGEKHVLTWHVDTNGKDYALVDENGAYKTVAVDAKDVMSVTTTNGNDIMIWICEKVGDNLTFKNSVTGNYFAHPNSALALTADYSDDCLWTLTDSGRLAYADNTDKYIRYSVGGGNIETSKFAADSTNSSTGIYKLCDHSNVDVRDASDATCNAHGYTGDTYCVDCGALVAKGASTAIDSNSHNYVNGICIVCGRREVSSSNGVFFINLTDATHTMVVNGAHITLPHHPATGSIYTDGTYTWSVCSECGAIYGKTEIPSENVEDIEITEPVETGDVEAIF